MTKNEIETALNHALESFIKHDKHLLAVDASERSMSHRIAHHLSQLIKGYDVDCEYNRDGFDTKKLLLPIEQLSSDADEAVTVFPDIIVHRRGNNDYNLLVIEMKKAATTRDADHDRKKLCAFRRELKYNWAVLLVIGQNQNGKLIRTVEWVDGQQHV